jgi:hypothetical protein
MNREQVKEVFKVIANVYPQFEVTTEKVDIWARILKNENPAIIMRNAERHALESVYPPAISDLREVYHPAYNSNIIQQIEQWEKEVQKERANKE